MPKLTPKLEKLASLMFFIRGEKVLLDTDLAVLYGVEARALNQAVARNRKRFPDDFRFRLSNEDWEDLKHQIGIPSLPATASNSRNSGSMRSQIVTACMHEGSRGSHYAVGVQSDGKACP